jgi:hypothetical protein
LCPDKEPIDVILTGTVKLIIRPNSKGYSLTALLITRNDLQANTTKYGGDLLSMINIQFERCEGFGISRNLSHPELELNFKHVVSHVEGLKYASYRVSELERKIKQSEWKHQHSQYNYTYSVFPYILVTLISMYGIFRLGRFIFRLWPRNGTVRAIMGPSENVELSTRSGGAGNVVNISIKTSNESLSGNPETIPLQDLDSSSTKGSNPELRRSGRLQTSKSYF